MTDWTSQPPTEPGWYWYRIHGVLSVVELYWRTVGRMKPRLGGYWHQDWLWAENASGEWWPQELYKLTLGQEPGE